MEQCRCAYIFDFLNATFLRREPYCANWIFQLTLRENHSISIISWQRVAEVLSRRCSIEQMYSTVLQNLQENSWDSLLIKVGGMELHWKDTLLKEVLYSFAEILITPFLQYTYRRLVVVIFKYDQHNSLKQFSFVLSPFFDRSQALKITVSFRL